MQASRKANQQSLAPRLMLNELYLHKAKPKAAFEVSEEAARIAPDDPQVRFALGRAYGANGDFKRAKSLLSSLSRDFPESPAVHFQLGMLMLRMGEQEAARTHLQRTLDVQPNHYGALLAMGELEARQGNFDKAFALAEQLDKLAPDIPGPTVLRGDVYAYAGEYDAAVSAYREALKLLPSGRIIMKLHHALNNLGKEEQAQALLTDWLNDHPDDQTVRLASASIQQSAGNANSAIEHYERILAAAPDNVVALNNISWLYFEKGDPRAMEYAKRAYDLAPRQPAVADTYGWFLVQSDSVQQGLGILKRAARSAPDMPEIQYHFALALVQAGQSDQARPILKKMAMAEGTPSFNEAARQLLKTL